MTIHPCEFMSEYHTKLRMISQILKNGNLPPQLLTRKDQGIPWIWLEIKDICTDVVIEIIME
jgi:hypothetical protein